ncbi:MAG TPA: hypothetical protein VKV39_04110 [Candidatus Sulfotelmatobacter sp.]|nr:hypothetical protein [Candidatus Sulfotelmatobacter sp.]
MADPLVSWNAESRWLRYPERSRSSGGAKDLPCHKTMGATLNVCCRGRFLGPLAKAPAVGMTQA